VAGTDAEGTPAAEPDWEQGSLLPADAGALPLQWVHPANPQLKAGKSAMKVADREGEPLTKPFPIEVPAKQGDRMMVITQTCDIIKPPGEMPQVEVARVFTTTSGKMIAQAQDFGSARYFRVNAFDDPEALILDYGHRALLDKGFLGAVAPDNALVDGWNVVQRERLARWLGQRYSRPAIPDEDYEQITRPVRDAWKKLIEEDQDTATEYNRTFSEWRYRREEDGSLTLYLLSPEPEPDAVLALEVGDFLAEAITTVFPGPVNVATDRRSYHTFTKADELSTEQISMEWASQDEDSGDAAMPA
jgi:hypothetical protein